MIRRYPWAHPADDGESMSKIILEVRIYSVFPNLVGDRHLERLIRAGVTPFARSCIVHAGTNTILQSAGLKSLHIHWFFLSPHKQSRPPPGELTEAAFYIASRLEIAMRCGSSCLASQEGEGRWRSEQATAFSACGLFPSLTLPFSRGGEIFRTSLFEHHLFSKPVAALR